jgi:two-component system invasion response regulator UvrY
VRILIVDDHQIVREGLKRMLGLDDRADVFGDASTAAEALALIGEQDWDIAVLDISLGSSSGLELLNAIRKLRPRLPVLVLSMHSEEQYARRAFQAGASGYIMKNTPGAELSLAINRIARGGKYVSAKLAEALVAEPPSNLLPHERLSQREFEVLRLLASGRAVNEIADMLSLSDKTVSTYRGRILEKLQRKTTADLVRYALEHSLID